MTMLREFVKPMAIYQFGTANFPTLHVNLWILYIYYFIKKSAVNFISSLGKTAR